ncbi:MAG: putative hydrolase [bacterium ADurb.BinA186]|nr:MAG: putative hydrolase [bacterium ADurb.BinA186]
MITKKTLKQIEKFAESRFAKNKDSAHNMDHVKRVRDLAIHLSQGEAADTDVILAACYLHDVGGDAELNDPSGNTDHAVESAKIAKPFLEKLKIPQSKIDHILDCILSHRYRTEHKPKTLEAMIVFDADKLETVGAIGVARAFSWVGKNQAYIYKVEDIKKYSEKNMGGKANGRIRDKSKHSPQLNWETKDKHILSFLYTQKAKNIAKRRKKFSEKFFQELEAEILGRK